MKNKAGPVTYELIVASREASEIALDLVKEVLMASGIPLHEIVETDEKPFHHLSVYFTSNARARSLKNKLRQLKIKQISLRIKKLVKKDWFNKWKKELRPIQLTKSVMVIPAWQKASRYENRGTSSLVLDTGFAFGSGLHPTTRYMAELIERSKGRYGRFIDIGTGSGILALVALKNGATSVTAIDISRDAVESANANFLRNGFLKTKAQQKDIAKLNNKDGFDFVAANLITHDLIRLKKKLCRLVKRDCLLAVSGVSVNNLPFLQKEFRTLPLKCLKIIKAEGWCALLYKKL